MFRIAGTGCCLLDHLFTSVNFSSPEFLKVRSLQAGDGGINPGHLTFTDDFERFSGRPCLEALSEVTRGRPADSVNIGGPAIVPLVHAAQVLDPSEFAVCFYGTVGTDEDGKTLRRLLAKTPLGGERIQTRPGTTPFTFVLSDPHHDGGRGERAFVNNLGTAADMVGTDLDEAFYSADLVIFGATALVPQIHDNLGELLAKAKSRGAFTVVSTVYDFRNERLDPKSRWPLGSWDDPYHLVDLLIVEAIWEPLFSLEPETSAVPSSGACFPKRAMKPSSSTLTPRWWGG